MEQRDTIVIWGAGRIGRGFIADLFYSAGYSLTLVDDSPELVEQLNRAGKYIVVHAPDASSRQDFIITPDRILHTSQGSEIEIALQSAQFIALAVYPHTFQKAASQIAAYLPKRLASSGAPPLNILVCANLSNAAAKFRTALEDALPQGMFEEFKTRLGIVDTIIIRFASESPTHEPLLVWTNGYSKLLVNRSAFSGEFPDLDFLIPVVDIHAEETRKLYTFNMLHTLLGNHGWLHGCSMLHDCLELENIRQEGWGALQEASHALQHHFGFSREAMEDWKTMAWEQTSNPALSGPVTRMSGEPLRKLARTDRLVGPALLARQYGIETRHLIRGIAAGFHFNPPGDKEAQAVQELIREKGICEAVIQVCSLTADEKDLVDEIVLAYQRIPLEITWLENARKAYWQAFNYEKTYRGCGQCTAAAIMETLSLFDEQVFNAATALSGGVGQAGDATCSAYLGAVLVFGMFYPRQRRHFDGDRENKYRTFGMAQKLRQNFLEEYGSITCQEIHRRKYGRTFNLLDPSQRQPFEDAGAHGDFGCTLVAAKSARWAVEIIANENIKDELSTLE